MQETSDTRERSNNYHIDNTELTRRTLKVLHDFQREISTECHLQPVSASHVVNSLETISLNLKINELDSFNDTIIDDGVNLNERRYPKICQLDAEHACFAPKQSLWVPSLFEALSKNNSDGKEILLRPMDILFEADSQGNNVPQLMRGVSNPGTSRLKILIDLYSEKFADESMEKERKSIIDEIMHTLEACWKSRFIQYEKLVDDKVAYGKIIPSEIAEIFVRSLFWTNKSETCQLPSSLIEGNIPCVISGKRILSRFLSESESCSMASNIVLSLKSKKFLAQNASGTLLKSRKYGSSEEPIPSFPQHKAAVEALKLKRKKREIMARVTRQRSLDRDSIINPAYPDLWQEQS